MKIGVTVSIDVTKIDKARLYEGKKGKYLDCVTFIDIDQQDQYENNGFIAQGVSKEEKEQGVKGEILGNVKVFWKGESNGGQQAQPQQQATPAPSNDNGGGFPDDIPFMQHERGMVI